MSVDVSALPMAEALDYWRSKTGISREAFDKLDTAARSRSFACAGLAKQDQINQVMTALESALENGSTLAQFKKELAPLLEAQGWTGKKAWRVENIFRTNIQSAYMAGRYQQMSETADVRPFWKLVAVHDGRTRRTHLAVDGLVFRHDHPFWQTWYPPNGYSCRCTVVALSQRQVDAQGLTVQTEIPDRIKLTDPNTGMESFVTPLVDAGWGTNIGTDWLAGLTPAELDGELKDLETGAICRSGEYAEDSCKPPLASLDPRHIHTIGERDILPAGLSDDEYLGRFLGEFGIDDLYGSKAISLPGVQLPVVIGRDLFTVSGNPTQLKIRKRGRERYLPLLAKTIMNPYEIWHLAVSVNQRRKHALRMIRLFSGDAGVVGGYASFTLVEGRAWYGVTTFPSQTGGRDSDVLSYLEKQRVGTVLHREK